MLHQLNNSKKMNTNEETESLMIGNVPELVKVARREVVMGEVAIAVTEFLIAVPFAIHVAIQLVLKVLICAR
jgi:K+-transporting ATPase A subunit